MADRLLLTDLSALRFLLLIPVIMALYMVRSRYRRRQISSTMLWRSIRRDLEARQQLRLPPLSLLLLLELLAILAGTAALLKPALPAGDRSHLVLLVDVSSSMQATDVSPSRFGVAVQQARAAIQQQKEGEIASIVAAGPSPKLLASGADKTELLATLDHLQPGSASVDAGAALRLAEALILGTGGKGSALFLSDGLFGPNFQAPRLSIPVEYQPIGASGDNQGITAVDVRPYLDGSGRWSAFARVVNYSGNPANVTATATADGLLLDSRPLGLPAGGSSELTFDLPSGTKAFAVKLDAGTSFAADKQVELRIDTPYQRKLLLVSKDAGPIARVLSSVPGFQLSSIKPEEYTGAAGADVVVLDGFVPPKLPDAEVLLLDPPADAPGFSAKAIGSEATVLRSSPRNPLLNSVDLQSLRLGQTTQLETPEWARNVAEGPTGPLILQGDQAGRRIVIFAFNWQLYDLPRMQAFPLLISNALSELNPVALPREIQPGQSVLLRPMGDAREATVGLPDGSSRQVSLKDGAVSFGDTQQVGRYEVRWKGATLGELSSSFNVNLASP
ncbi:MAG TPA: BatA and WFA domain-containing protein, partial [Chloroflexota bacterium]|nr:BatA and WFA domain-containing protein [Chloroflexota bacterium]